MCFAPIDNVVIVITARDGPAHDQELTGGTYPGIVNSTDEDFGPFFLKFCSYSQSWPAPETIGVPCRGVCSVIGAE